MKKLVLILLASAGLLAAAPQAEAGYRYNNGYGYRSHRYGGYGYRTASYYRPYTYDYHRPYYRSYYRPYYRPARYYGGYYNSCYRRSTTTRRVRGFPSPSDSKTSRCAELENLGDHLVAGCSFRLAFEVQDDSMTQCGERGFVDVGTGDVVPFVEQRMNFCSENQRLRAARAGAVADVPLREG